MTMGWAASYDELGEGELIEVISSLDVDALARLRDYEASHGRRELVLDTLDRSLARLRERDE